MVKPKCESATFLCVYFCHPQQLHGHNQGAQRLFLHHITTRCGYRWTWASVSASGEHYWSATTLDTSETTPAYLQGREEINGDGFLKVGLTCFLATQFHSVLLISIISHIGRERKKKAVEKEERNVNLLGQIRRKCQGLCLCSSGRRNIVSNTVCSPVAEACRSFRDLWFAWLNSDLLNQLTLRSNLKLYQSKSCCIICIKELTQMNEWIHICIYIPICICSVCVCTVRENVV